MKKSMMAVAMVAVLAAAAARGADVRPKRAVAALLPRESSVALPAGAIIGSAAYPYYGYGYYPGYPAPAYVPGPAYYGPPPGCVLRRQRVGDGYAWRRQNIRVCH